MALGTVPEREIEELEGRLTREPASHEPFTLTPAWWQQRLLEWATSDPDFRVKLLRFVDVLPTLRSARAVADHVRQYFRDAHPGLVHAASGLAAQPIFRPVLSQVVRRGVFAMADRFIAGASPKEALPALRRLAADGVAYTVDLLGEETLSDAEANAYLDRYLDLIETLSADSELAAPAGGGESESLARPVANISVKLSALCSHLEPAAPQYVSASTRERLRPLLRAARGRGAFVNFDMEQYRYKELVHTAFADLLLEQEFSDYPHTGIVVQAYLRDALNDIDRLLALARRRGTPLTVRLVRGAYWDEENIFASQNRWTTPVWEEKAETDASFERCTDALLAAWPHLRFAFGTHNPHSLAQAAAKAQSAGLSRGDIEFQMLYGMAEELRRAIAGEGYLTRVYVPVGEVIPGMAYLVRRLLENTSNQAWFNIGARPRDGRGQQPAGLSDQQSGSTDRESARAEDHGAEARTPVFENAAPAQFFIPAARRAMLEALDRLRAEFGRTYPLLVGGDAVSDRERAELRCPADPTIVLGRVAQATRADVDTAVQAAREAFPAWRDLTAKERGDALRRAAEIMEARRFELAATMVFESAKPWHEADGDLIEAIDYLRYYALQGEYLAEPRWLPEEDPAAAGHPVLGERNEHFYEGRGVSAVIAPWNFPLAIICGMSVGALAGGNCAILKPAAQSPIIAFKLVEALREAGVPAGAVQYLPGPGGEVGQALVEHPAVDNIVFTGSSAVGLRLIEAAARRPAESRPAPEDGQTSEQRRPNVKRVVAEMGGKNAVIIDEDADLDQAIQGVITSAFGYAGQKCSACSRLVIVGSAYDGALARLKNAVASLVVGPPDDPATLVPPVIGEDARQRIFGYIESGNRHASLLVQAPIPAAVAASGYYVPPTVFTQVPLGSPLACEEIFGPVLAVFRADDFEEALRIALHSEFALTGGVFSRNPRHIALARRAFRVGNLYINRKTTGAVVGRQPFGGLHMSGVGEKAGGPDYVRQFMDSRTVSENTARRGFAPEAGE